ncbi:serA, partial [Symbiodinium sp. CCMP2592]
MDLPVSFANAPSGKDEPSFSGQVTRSSMPANAAQGTLLPNAVPGIDEQGLRSWDLVRKEAFPSRVNCLDPEEFDKLRREIGREDVDHQDINVRLRYNLRLQHRQVPDGAA